MRGEGIRATLCLHGAARRPTSISSISVTSNLALPKCKFLPKTSGWRNEGMQRGDVGLTVGRSRDFIPRTNASRRECKRNGWLVSRARNQDVYVIQPFRNGHSDITKHLRILSCFFSIIGINLVSLKDVYNCPSINWSLRKSNDITFGLCVECFTVDVAQTVL